MYTLVRRAMSITLTLVCSFAQAQDRDPAMTPNRTSVTSQEAADAAKRQAETGTTNKTAADNLKKLDAEEKKTYAPPPKENPKPAPKK
ncbi:hypothetical protein [Janthinobacterium svalbardensis]|uniref:hypothetical protein n=1 Tax=Janthinobacterium svalbardensis TaxID=368607 RepID=UPI002FCDB55C